MKNRINLDFMLINFPAPQGKISNKDMMGGFGQMYEGGKDTSKIPTIDMAYVAGESQKEGLKFSVIDGLVENLLFNQILLRILENNPKYLFIRTSTSSFDWDISLIDKISLKFKGDIFLFGPHVEQNREEVMGFKGIRGIVTSEPEKTIPEIFLKGLNKTKGIWYKKSLNLVRNLDRKLIVDLDKISFPAWEYFPYTEYKSGPHIRDIQPFVTMLTSRGCPYSCIYCPYPLGQGKKFRGRSAKNVVDEFVMLKERYGVKAVLLRDPVFSFDQKRAEEICNGLIQKKINVSWRCETRIDCLSEKLVKLMAKAGCIGINIGLESFSIEVLRNLKTRPKKHMSLKKLVRLCRKVDLELYLFFIIGLPRESKKSMLKTIKMVRRLGVRFSQFTISTPYPNTKLKSWAEENNFIIDGSKNKITGYECMMRNERMGPETITSLYKYANFSSSLGAYNVLRRIKERGLLQIVREFVKILISFQLFLRVLFKSEEK